MTMREALPEDWPALWRIIQPVLRAGDTYTVAPDLSEAEARAFWMRPAPWRVVVIEDGDQIIASGKMGPNQAGPGGSVANASYMVAARARGQGLGRRLVVETLRWARAAGYRGVQFNAVAQSNRGAVRLYQDLGFQIIGTVPEAFDHPQEGPVGLHIMYHRF